MNSTHMIPLQNVRQTLLELPWNSLVSRALIFDSQKFSAKNILRDDESESCLNTFFGLSVSTNVLSSPNCRTADMWTHFRCRRSSITNIFGNYIRDFIDRERIICLLLFKQLYRLNLHVEILSSPCHKANGSGIEMKRWKIIAQQSIGSSFVRIAEAWWKISQRSALNLTEKLSVGLIELRTCAGYANRWVFQRCFIASKKWRTTSTARHLSRSQKLRAFKAT